MCKPASAPLCTSRRKDELVFSGPAGEVLRAQTFGRRVLDPNAAAMGLDGLHVHELRHTAASLAVSAGANVKAVQTMLGHANAAMTLNTYTDLVPRRLGRRSRRSRQGPRKKSRGHFADIAGSDRTAPHSKKPLTRAFSGGESTPNGTRTRAAALKGRLI
jgi:integrase